MAVEILHPLVDQFYKADSELKPAGLYSAEKQVLWSKVLYPVLKHGGGKVGYSRPGRFVCFTDSEGREGIAELLSFSTVKVRRFGNRFAADTHINYHDRWDDRRVQKMICDLWTKDDRVRRLLIVIGFEQNPDPFHQELRLLAEEIDWLSRGARHVKNVWRDSWNREFSCVVAIWEK